MLGMIFQLTDDCMDFESTEDYAKKPVQSDFEQGVITLPLIYTFHEMVDFKEKAAVSGVTRKEINEAVVKAGGLGFTHKLVQKYYSKSMHIIKELDITDNKKEKLVAILNKVTRIL
jgi:heptaprenyl diphosphate synthase